MNDVQIQSLIDAEIQRQQTGLELIPSENYVSRDVLTALGSVFTNKYAEGYPGRRYYGGQANTDQVEALAIERATPMSNPILAHRPMKQCTTLGVSLATPS